MRAKVYTIQDDTMVVYLRTGYAIATDAKLEFRERITAPGPIDNAEGVRRHTRRVSSPLRERRNTRPTRGVNLLDRIRRRSYTKCCNSLKEGPRQSSPLNDRTVSNDR